MRTSSGIAAKNGSQLRTARPLRCSADPPWSPATLHLLRLAAAQQARGLHEQDQDQDRERDGILPGRADVTGDELLRDAEDQSAEHGARHVPDAAEDGGDERL